MLKYDQKVDFSTDNSVSIILRHINPSTRVLEFGPSTGYMTRYMNDELNCKVYCVEIDEQAANISKKYSEKMIIGDLDTMEWLNELKGELFDHIIFSDVLEHLKDPWEVLTQAVSLLKENGTVLTSIPNIAHNAVIMELLQGKFEYRNTGLLDDTHIRFFTRRSVLELLQHVGLCPISWLGTVLYPEYTELRQQYTEFPDSIKRILKSRNDAHVYQFVTVSKRIQDVKSEEICVNFNVNNASTNYGTIQVFWENDGAFDESHSVKIPLEHQSGFGCYNIGLPLEANGRKLRIDPVDRKSVIEIKKVALYKGSSVDPLVSYSSENKFKGLILSGVLYHSSDGNFLKMVSIDEDPQILIDSLENVDDDNALIIKIELKISDNIVETIIEEIDFIRDEFVTKEQEITEKVTEIFNLQDSFAETILEKDTQIYQLTAKQELLLEKQKQLLEMNLRFSEELKEKDRILNNYVSSTQELQTQLNLIMNSEGWKLLIKYYKIRDKVFPQGSIARKLAVSNWKLIKLTRKSIKYIKTYGAKAFLYKIKNKLRTNKKINQHISPEIKLVNTPQIEMVHYDDANISVIIPTKNAGDDLEPLLSMLINQKGINSIEIIIVDSGSTDNTIKIAEIYNAKIINILPEEFSHSYSRNLGAQNGTGNYLLFTTQDALPPSDHWMYELLNTLKNNNIAAVSCAETPREDADLFYRVICWNHYRFLEVNQSDRIMSLPDSSDHISLRKNGQLSDIANLISKELFDKYGYRFNYAEDLDLGIRLIKDGHSIAFLGSTRVIHSHLRDAFYFLKRGYVDNLFLSDIFSDFPIPNVNYEGFIKDILYTYNVINKIISNLSGLKRGYEVKKFSSFIINGIEMGINDSYSPKIPLEHTEYLDQQLIAFLNDISSYYLYEPERKYDGILLHALRGFLDITLEYLELTYEQIDTNLIKEFSMCIIKEFALLVGAHLAYCHLRSDEEKKKIYNGFHLLLSKGV